jgi:hypothetical protein
MTLSILHHQQLPNPMEAQQYSSYLRTKPKIQMVFLPVIPENSPSPAEVVRPILGPHALRPRLGGRFACLTADCGSGDTGGVHAKQRGGAGLLRREPGGQVQPPSRGGATWRGGAWRPTGCLVDLNGLCPAGLRGAWHAAARARFCCGEAYSLETCGPSEYSLYFKRAVGVSLWVATAGNDPSG